MGWLFRPWVLDAESRGSSGFLAYCPVRQGSAAPWGTTWSSPSLERPPVYGSSSSSNGKPTSQHHLLCRGKQGVLQA